MSYEPPVSDDQPYLVHLRPEPDDEPLYRRKRLILPAAAAVAVIGVAAAGFLMLGGDGDDDKQLASATPTTARTTASARATSGVPSVAATASAARPSATVSASVSASPSMRSSSASPSASATPSAKVGATPTPTPGATAVTFRGTGPKVVEFTRTIGATMLMTTTWRGGDGAVTVHALSRDGRSDALQVSADDTYDGQGLFNTGGKAMSGLRIQGKGSWTVKLAPLDTARRWTGNGTYAGTGDGVVRVEGVFTDGDAMRFVSKGADAAVAVRSYDADGDDELVVDDLKSFSGRYEVPAGTVYLAVRSDSTWTVRRL